MKLTNKFWKYVIWLWNPHYSEFVYRSLLNIHNQATTLNRLLIQARTLIFDFPSMCDSRIELVDLKEGAKWFAIASNVGF